LKKGTPWIWKNDQEEVFNKIKQFFLDDIVIQYPDFNRTFYLSTDTPSTQYIGAELFKISEENVQKKKSAEHLMRLNRGVILPNESYLAIVFGCNKF